VIIIDIGNDGVGGSNDDFVGERGIKQEIGVLTDGEWLSASPNYT
jgi:hypothetical protein